MFTLFSSGLCAVLMLYLFFKKSDFKYCWLSMGGIGLFVLVAEIRWLIVANQGLNASNDILIGALYTCANIGFTVTLLLYFIYRKSSWDSTQLLIDLSAIATVMMTLMWIFFYQAEADIYSRINILWPYITYLAIIADFLTLTFLLCIYLSSRVGKIPAVYKLISMGILLYVIADLVYTYESSIGTYLSGGLLDYAYTGSLLILTIAGILELKNPEKGSLAVLSTAEPLFDIRHRVKVLYFAPLLVLLVRGLKFFEIAVTLAIIILHQWVTAYTKSIKHQRLLASEKEMSFRLEQLVSQRTQEIEESQKRFQLLSMQDPLTGLYNRRYFFDMLSELTVDEPSRVENNIAILMLDLDRFKEINDVHGHQVGDQVLIEISNRLAIKQSEDCRVFRMGGDEFVIVGVGMSSIETLSRIAQELIDLCQTPICLTTCEFKIRVSIGIARYPFDSYDIEELLKFADIAMYQAKASYGGRYQFFNKQLASKIIRKQQLLAALKAVDMDKEFELYYQPQYQIPERLLVGAEALLRWNSPVLGNVSPAEFIPLAEECGLICSIGTWVIRKAIKQIGIWTKLYNTKIRMGINISPKQLFQNGFDEFLEQIIVESGLDPRRIDLEITETTAMQMDLQIVEFMKRFSGIGCSISLDDFGTGYSSLSYIKRFEIDRIKIAKELIADIDSDPDSEMIVYAIILMSKALGLQTIAEGVETESQLNLLAKLGCNDTQGYFLSRPLSVESFEDLF